MFLEEVDSFPALRPNNANDLSKFADLLDILAINLKESNLESELGSGLLYIKLQKKLGKNKLAAFHRYLFENKIEGSVMTLRTWILQENSFEVIADETTKGVIQRSGPGIEVFHNNRVKKCIYCKEEHNIKDCKQLLDLSVEERNVKVGKLGCCFKCLQPGHFKRDCRVKVICEVCQKAHHTLFHGLNLQNISYHLGNIESGRISLRTVPIIISYEGREVQVNCILDDGSTSSFVNSEVVDTLGIPRENSQKMAVGVLNGSSESFSSSNVTFKAISMDRKRNFSISANTIHKVTGNLVPVNWAEQAKSFRHLRRIPFYGPNKCNVALLLGLDHAYLHQALREIRGGTI